MGKYFEKFPTISYNGVPAKNILLRTKISQETFNQRDAFIEYELPDGIYRPDVISNKYYENPYYDWLYYMSNEIVNPYTDRYMSSEELASYIKSKYGSIDYTRNYIIEYRNNWAVDDSEITVETYNSLSVAQRKYYTMVVDYFGSISGYKRKQIDWTLDNNKIRILTIPESYKMTYLAVGEFYRQVNSSGETVAQGLLRGYDLTNRTLTFTRITGEFQSGSEYRLVGIYKYKNWKYQVSAISNPYVVDGIGKDPISTEESLFWSPVYLYDRIIEDNEEKKKIKLLRNSLKGKAEQSMKKLLRY